MMQVVFLYGPPAAGKLAVAREVVSLTGFKLFHNHLTFDLVAAVFPFGSEPFSRMLHRIRREMLAEAASAGVDLVFTYVYAAPYDDDAVQEMVEEVRAGGGAVRFVQLTCRRDALLARVTDASRSAHGKLTNPAALDKLLDRYDLLAPIPFGESLRIDTGYLSPAAAAAQIVAHYALPTVAP